MILSNPQRTSLEIQFTNKKERILLDASFALLNKLEKQELNLHFTFE